MGEKVKRGERIGRLGNSGSTSAAHLHFAVMAGAQPLTATQVPWVIDRFRLQGTATASFNPGEDGIRKGQMPLISTVTGFPAATQPGRR